MLNKLVLVNLPVGWSVKFPLKKSCFILATCQRTLLIDAQESFLEYVKDSTKNNQVFRGEKAYETALEILCGFRSKVLAEGEIVCQFRKAYREYLAIKNKDPFILSVLERLLKDTKEIRSKYLKGIGGQSYGGIVRKILLTNRAQRIRGRLLIKGSGHLADKLVKLLKKDFQLYITSRNKRTVTDLVNRYGIASLPWESPTLFRDFSVIVNTIGAKEILFDREFFSSWHQNHSHHLYIDLGSPSVLETTLKKKDGVWCLEDVFEEGKKWEWESLEKVKRAKSVIPSLIQRRRDFFGPYPSLSREKLQLA